MTRATPRPSLVAQAGALADIRVVELGGIGPVPFACMMLADFGADVVRIDRPEPQPPLEDPLMRGRERYVVDLRDPAGLDGVRELIRRADVVVEGFRPGVTERLGLGPEQFADNEALVYARMSGWGQDGPNAAVAGHDINYIAASGFLDAVGTRTSGPVVPLNVLGDYAGGGALLAFGIVAAVHEARRSGRGQVIDASLVDGSSYLMTKIQAFVSDGRWTERRASNFLDGGAPYYRVYETADGRHLAVGALEPQFYAALLSVLGLDGLPDRDDRSNWDEIGRMLADTFRTRTRDEWVQAFDGVDACVTPVLSFSEARADRHARTRDAFVEVGDIVQPAPAPRLGRTPARAGKPTSPAGTGDPETLRDWGLAGRTIDVLTGASS